MAHTHTHQQGSEGKHNHSSPHAHGANAPKNVLITALLLISIFAVFEAIAGWFSGSLALMSDAGHMVADALAIGLAAFAAWVAKKPPSEQHSYGLGRAEVVGAWISSLSLLLLAVIIIVEAIRRLHQPEHVRAGFVVVVGSIGLLMNLIVAWVLSRGERTLNVRAAILHVLGDILGSLAAVISGAVIFYTNWTPIDPILSIFISLLIIASSIALLRESLLVLMEAVPKHLDFNEVSLSLSDVKGVQNIHDLHIWTLASGMIVLTAHVDIHDYAAWDTIFSDLTKMLNDKYGITHATLQPETHTITEHHAPEGPCNE